MFGSGDVANTSAIKAGHTGWFQAIVAAENITRLLKDGNEAELELYKPTKPMIKVSIGKVSFADAGLHSSSKAHVPLPVTFTGSRCFSNVGRRRDC